jgi:hypothetical protein
MGPTDQLGAAALAYANLGYRVLPLHHPIAIDTTRGGGRCSAPAATVPAGPSASIP